MVEMVGVLQLRALLSRHHRFAELERSRLARVVHDDVSQHVMALKIGLAALERRFSQAKVTEMQTVADELIQNVRQLATDLRPAVLDSLGLASAIRWQAGNSQKILGIPIRCELADVPVDADTSTVAFWLLQEGLSNIARHAQASQVTIRLEQRGDQAVLELSDDGRGFETDNPASDCLGMLDMQERIAAAGGTLTIDSRPGKGTRLTALLPTKGTAS